MKYTKVTDETPWEIRERISRIQFAGGIKCWYNENGSAFGTFHTPEGDVEVIVTKFTWPINVYDIRMEGWGYYGPELPEFSDSDHLLTMSTFYRFTRRNWTRTGGNFLLVRTSAFDERDHRARLAFKFPKFGDPWDVVKSFYFNELSILEEA